MDRAPDKRIERTRTALMNAIYALLEDNSLEEITVLKLCETAGIKRATFYIHFRDINQFIDYCLTEKFHEVFPPISQNNPHPSRNEYLNGLFERVFDFVDKNRIMLKLNLEKLNPSTLHNLFYLEMRSEMINKVAELSERGYIFLVPAQIIGEYYAGAMTALINWWLINETDVTKEQLANYFNLIIEKEYAKYPV